MSLTALLLSTSIIGPSVIPVDIHRVPWTAAGGRFFLNAIEDMCRNGGITTCKSVKPGGTTTDYGVKVYLADGTYLFKFSRAHAEEVQQIGLQA